MRTLAFIESVDHEGVGVAHVDGKVAFIDGGVTGETVAYSKRRSKGNYDLGTVTEVVGRESSMRVTPRCSYFGNCGGCAMQHIEGSAQVAAKQRVLEDNLARIGKAPAEMMLPPIFGPAWGYRTRARLSVHYVHKKGGVLVGFHEKRSSFVADTFSCEVLTPAVSAMIPALREMFTSLATRDRLPQIELAVGEDVTALVLRHLDPIPEEDQEKLRAFADTHGIQWWLQPKGPETAHPWYPKDAPELDYRLPEFGLSLAFGPTEFTQVNPGVNRTLVSRAVKMLDPRPGERVGDLFCGLGNFSLAIAARGADVIGMEGAPSLVARAQANARRNGLEARAKFVSFDLYKNAEGAIENLGHVDKLLIDPPRDGALDICKALPEPGPERIVYVSCSPSTLARDAGVLVHVKGYRLMAAGVVNMFPHTGHVESIALFQR
ncbi:23S rRNA (uracil(1939)-C(5))-methyltransferase RlmD [Usitatibacter palustris]|uniref:23S rRNA (uracil(1939)-C(5))-methyltransferase RlmD n=1 Tax=Usitatibacter palustris TaxID=2732487 RepID=A0A6M4H561_9PROT|nr:23S rRNA (uracil(1939)-C(5))-methyltransferase RlmD [Usitatibacter palustris]QJR14295.1 23S rRNA (uracil(1939)-C(5))-methyltransferase RlmD [Usitatibacter palustris]